jgi:hypothetical protein
VLNPDKIIKIPSEFTLLGHKYKVVMCNKLFEDEDCYGTADGDLKLIRLQSTGSVIRRYEEDGKSYENTLIITDDTLIETFFHELVHIILDATGEIELTENERFVNMMGKSLLEIYQTSNYEKDSS